MKNTTIKIPAIETQQGGGRKIYAFAIDGKELHSVASISRLARNDELDLEGYQRPEVLGHISQIRDYIESEDAIIPNALVVAFDSSVIFTPLKLANKSKKEISQHGHLEIPVKKDDEEKCGWIVDGQQRAAAIRDANRSNFPVFVVCFITDSVEEQRAQFILVNSTKPLPKGLIYELLPGTDVQLPLALQKKRFPAYLLGRLNFDVRSPFQGMVKTPTTPDGTIRDNSVLRMIENSLNDGALYRFQDHLTGDSDTEAMLELLYNFWSVVAETFPEAWQLPPTKSRLTHGAGMATLGYLMDAIVDRHRHDGLPTKEQFEGDLAPLIPYCSWTSGYWDFGPGAKRKWNEIQNTSSDIQLLANYLLVKYKHLVWDKAE